MSGLFQVNPQFHTLSGTTEIDPRRIPEYPISQRLRGIEGRNIVGQPWDVLAAQADKAKQAEEKMVALRYAAEDTGIPEGRVYQMDRIDPHVFDHVAQNQQGITPGPLGYTPPVQAPQHIDLTAHDAPTEIAEAPDAGDLPLPSSIRMPPTAPETLLPAEVSLIRNVGERQEQINQARRGMAARRIQRLARERMEQMDHDMEQRRLIASAEQRTETRVDLPGTIAAGGTQAIGADDGVSRRTVVGHVQQAPQMPEPEELYTPQEMADLINVENHDAKMEMLSKLLSHAVDGLPFYNNQVVDMDFFHQTMALVPLEEKAGASGADGLGFQSQSSKADFRERVDGQPAPPTTTVAISSNVTQVADPQAKDAPLF